MTDTAPPSRSISRYLADLRRWAIADRRLLPVFLGGCATGLANEPLGWWWLAWVGLVPLWQQVRADDRDDRGLALRRAALVGAVWGLGFDGVTLHWITGVHPMMWMGVPWAQSVAIAAFCWVAIVAVGGAVPVVWAIAMRGLDRWSRSRGSGLWLDVWLIATGAGLWALLETLWSHGALWWPWLSLTQSPGNLAILQLDRLSGPTVVSAAIVLANGLLALGCGTELRSASLRRRFIAIAIGLCVGLHAIGALSMGLDRAPDPNRAAPPFEVGIVQGNIPNDIKLYPGGIRKALLNYRDGYNDLADRGVDIVLTPETALPLFWDGARNTYSPDGQLGLAIGDRGVPVWLGTMQGDRRRYTNSLLTVVPDADGRLATASRYDKVKLVPLGEYVPFADLLGDLITRLSPLTAILEFGDRGQTFDTPFGRAAVAICYESAFPEPLRRQVAAGAEFILSVANNAHYSSTMPSQHHAQDVMRAIELDRPIARATNTGYSAIIDARGRTRWKSGLDTLETHRAIVAPRATRTPYVRWGNWFAKIAIAWIAIGASGLLIYSRRSAR